MAKAPFTLSKAPLDAETREIAERELNETPERTAEAVQELRHLLQENSDLHFSDDEKFLIAILRPCHFYPESAIKLVSRKSASSESFAHAIPLENVFDVTFLYFVWP